MYTQTQANTNNDNNNKRKKNYNSEKAEQKNETYIVNYNTTPCPEKGPTVFPE